MAAAATSAAAAPPAAYLAGLQARARSLRLADSRQWRGLLHDGWSTTGSGSEITTPSFFFSSRGRKDPAEELDATLAAFFAPADTPDRLAACRFPGRFAWLDEKLGFDPAVLPAPDCPALSAWRGRVGGSRVSLVFADAYMNNPSSMYGHTFLIFHPEGSTSRLLDTAVNFAADADTANGALFAIYGLAGVFPGRFSAMPYYLRVQEYSNLESRDLWEYQLALSSAAVRRLVDHLWELGDATFPYYFFNKNCSWQLLPVLDVAEPRLHLADHWPLYLVPTDTVRSVAQTPGLVAERRYRPSHVTSMLYHRSLLSEDEIKEVESLISASTSSARTASEQRRALVLWTASEYAEFLIDYKRNPDPRLVERQRAIHLALGRLGVQTAPPDPPAGSPPESGHGTARFGLAGGFQNRAGYEEFSARATLHDLLDAPAGYAPSSTLEMFGLTLRHRSEPDRFWIQRLDLVRILSLSPLDRWIKKPSWEVDGGLRNAEELGKAPWNSDYFGVTLGSGVSTRTRLAGTQTWFALGEADGGAGDVFRRGHRLGPGATAGVFWELTNRWRAKLDASYYDYVLGDARTEGRLRAETAYDLSKAWSARLRAQSYGLVDELQFSIMRYF